MDENNDNEMILGFESNPDVKFCVPEEPSSCPSLSPAPGQSSLLDKLHQVLGPLCDLECRMCKKYIHKLSQHIKAKHNRKDGDERAHDSPNVEAQSSLSPMDLDLDLLPEGHDDNEIEVKYEPFSQELENPNTTLTLLATAHRQRGRPPVGKKVVKKKKKIKLKRTRLEVKFTRKSKRLPCTICQQLFKRDTTLRRHMLTHTEKPYKCDTCDESFRNRAYLTVHEKVTHMGHKSFTCTICGRDFLSQFSLKEHVQRTHRLKNFYECEHCNESFPLKESLTRHRKIHVGEKLYMCEVCSARFVSNKSLKKHLIIHTKQPAEKSFVCEHCGKNWSSTYKLKRHMETHSRDGDKSKSFVCEHCGKSLSSEKMLSSHIHLKHEKEQPSFPCDVCEQKFTDPNQLILHKKIHAGDEHKILKCDHCPKLFLKGRKSGRWQHMQSHNAENTFECDQCHKMYKSKQNLQKHSRRKHTGVIEKSKKCEECGKSYHKPYELRRHMRSVHNSQEEDQGNEVNN